MLTLVALGGPSTHYSSATPNRFSGLSHPLFRRPQMRSVHGASGSAMMSSSESGRSGEMTIHTAGRLPTSSPTYPNATASGDKRNPSGLPGGQEEADPAGPTREPVPNRRSGYEIDRQWFRERTESGRITGIGADGGAMVRTSP